MYSKKSLMFLLLITGLSSISSLTIAQIYSQNKTINTIEVIDNTLKGASNCIHYHVSGLCFWRVCAGPYCSIQTTLKLDHYLPDEVVTVYKQSTNNPWDYAQKIIDPTALKAGQAIIHQQTEFRLGYGDSNDDPADNSNKYHEVDVIGNPALTILSGKQILLPSTAVPFLPYYSSLLDAKAWRFPFSEQLYPGYWMPGLHDIGTIGLHNWGPIYPRNGFVTQLDDAKAAAVVAMRSTHIVTREGQPHIYTALSSNCGEHCQAAEVNENNSDTQFQMIYPFVENACMVFGNSDITSLHPWGMEAAKEGDGNYIWILWRRYQGCVQDAGEYIGDIDF